MRMLDVDAEAELLQDPPLSFDNEIFQLDIVNVQYHRLYRSAHIQEKKKTQVETPSITVLRRKLYEWRSAIRSRK